MPLVLFRVECNQEEWDAVLVTNNQIVCSNWMWEHLKLILGKDQPQLSCIFQLTDEKGTWYPGQIRREQYVPNKSVLIMNCSKRILKTLLLYYWALNNWIFWVWIHTFRHLQHLCWKTHHFVPCRSHKEFMV